MVVLICHLCIRLGCVSFLMNCYFFISANITHTFEFWYLVRKALHLVSSNSETSLNHLPNKAPDAFNVAHLILRLLPSKDGVALRRLLMTAVSSYKLSIFCFFYVLQDFVTIPILVIYIGYFFNFMFNCFFRTSNRCTVKFICLCGCNW